MAMKRLWEVFERPGTDWLGALSEFYLRQRMHRFGGITITDGCHTRLTLNPLSDSHVLALANAVPPKLRAGSGQKASGYAALSTCSLPGTACRTCRR